MAKQMKIKRSKHNKGVYKARPRVLTVIVIAVAAVGLGYLGFVSYQPIYNAIMNSINSVPEVSAPEPVSTPDEAPAGQEQPDPAPQPVSELKAVYLPPAAVSDSAALDAMLARVEGAGLNAVMVDIKDKQGRVLFDTANQSAAAWGAVAEDAFDLDALCEKLEGRGIALIVRMSAFRDETAARGELDNAVNYRSPGTTWLDNFPDMGGKPWLNPYAAGAQRYLTDLAVEAARAGAALVVLDDFQFPPSSLTGDAYFGPQAAGISRAQVLGDYAQSLTDTLAGHGARLAIYQTAATLAGGPNDTLYGGEPDAILAGAVALGALPYQFGERFAVNGLEVTSPRTDLAATVRQVTAYAQGKLGDTGIIPLILGGNEAGAAAAYTAAQIEAQIAELDKLGVEEYIFYCTEVGGDLAP